MTTLRARTLHTPIGPIGLIASERALVEVRLPPSRDGDGSAAARRKRASWTEADVEPAMPGAHATLDRAASELERYFERRLTRFTVPVEFSGTPFQETVWHALLEIPFGELRSYGWVADRIGRRNASRAVGAANGGNPLAIVVPCHRVIGADGRLTGYGGGLAAKRWLLEHEGSLDQPPEPS